jgi:hypothetical protein
MQINGTDIDTHNPVLRKLQKISTSQQRTRPIHYYYTVTLRTATHSTKNITNTSTKRR